MKTLLICIVFIVPSMAQDDSTFFWGVKAGFTFSHIEGAGKRTAGKLNHPTKNTGIILGINFNRIINDRNTQQAELYFVHKGSKWGQPLIGLGYDGDYAIYNLEFFLSGNYNWFNTAAPIASVPNILSAAV